MQKSADDASCAQVRPEAETELTRYTHAGVQHEVRIFPLQPGTPLDLILGTFVVVGRCHCRVSLQWSIRFVPDQGGCPPGGGWFV